MPEKKNKGHQTVGEIVENEKQDCSAADIQELIDSQDILKFVGQLYYEASFQEQPLQMLLLHAAKIISEQRRELNSLQGSEDCANIAASELENTKKALAEMWFAYTNKDPDAPHSFEEKAVAKAEKIFGGWDGTKHYLAENDSAG